MGAAAEFGGEVADADDADALAVLFAEEGHGAEVFYRLVDRNIDQGLDVGVSEDLAVDDVFDLLHLGLGDAGEVGEVEAEAALVDEGAGLFDVFAEDLAESGV